MVSISVILALVLLINFVVSPTVVTVWLGFGNLATHINCRSAQTSDVLLNHKPLLSILLSCRTLDVNHS